MKALVGAWDHRSAEVLAEIAALRARVAHLEEALTHAQEENKALRVALADRDVLREREDTEVALPVS